jgi:2-dehydro-3-deoxygalactonokinase
VTIGSDPLVAAVDWGTSRLRIWLLDASGAVLAERRSDEGLLGVGSEGFSAVLERHLGEMNAPATTSVVICGMAGSRQGWLEVPYVAVPARLADVLAKAVPLPGGRRDVRIIPGVAQKSPDAPDVMRGEETQLAGITRSLAEGRHLVCMPGTHSKWVDIENGTITRFGTWLTGELFSVLTQHSILRHAVGTKPASVSPGNSVFRSWLEQALASPADLTSRLFKIRASTLLADLGPDDAAAALSGLLIGTEIGSARTQFGWRQRDVVVLIASGALGELYAEALRIAEHRVEAVDADTAVRAGLFEAALGHLADGGSERAKA